MADRVDQLIQRKKMGDLILSPEEKEELQNALYGLAPSSARYRQIMEALGKPRESSYVSPNTNPDGTQKKVSGGMPTFQGPPTLDFLNMDHAGMIDMPEGSAARGFDASGSVLGDTKLQDMYGKEHGDVSWSELMGGGGLTANSALGYDTPVTSDLAEERFDPGTILENQPEGYSWSGMAPAMISETRNDPRVFANLLAKDMGGGQGTAAQLMPYLQGADSLAAQGVFGGPTANNTIFGGPTSDVAAMAQIEDVADLMAQPGTQFIDTNELYGRSFDRLGNTDFSQYSGDNGQPLSNDDIIEVTNAALMASAPFMTQETAGYLSARLNQAGVEYKTLLATGEVGNISYPAYLKSIGADQWLGQ
jgi:hypothetical protein